MIREWIERDDVCSMYFHISCGVNVLRGLGPSSLCQREYYFRGGYYSKKSPVSTRNFNTFPTS